MKTLTPEQRITFLENKIKIIEKENDDLRFELRQIRGDRARKRAFPLIWGLTPVQSEMLTYMVETGNRLTTENFTVVLPRYSTGRVDKLPTDKNLDAHICKLRGTLRSAGLEDIVLTLWGRGYYINPDKLEFMRKFLK